MPGRWIYGRYQVKRVGKVRSWLSQLSCSCVNASAQMAAVGLRELPPDTAFPVSVQRARNGPSLKSNCESVELCNRTTFCICCVFVYVCFK